MKFMPHITIQSKITYRLHSEFTSLAKENGLTPAQALAFVLQWAVTHKTITPDK